MALPCGTTGSLCSTFVPARLVSLTVKHPCAIALYVRLPSVLRVPLEASVTLLGGDHPSQTTHHTLFFFYEVRYRIIEGWYFKDDSTTPSDAASKSPHLSYTSIIQYQCEVVVKVHGVFPSRCGYSASSPRLQFHRARG